MAISARLLRRLYFITSAPSTKRRTLWWSVTGNIYSFVVFLSY